MAKKAENQWYGKAFEQVINAVFHQVKINNPYPLHVEEKDFQKMFKHAKSFIENFEKKYFKINSMEWVGNKTSTENGDLIVNGLVVEVKYTEKGNATWLNTNMDRFHDTYGFPKTYKDYMMEAGLYDILVKNLGEEVSLENVSPISDGARAKKIQSMSFYKDYAKKENDVRTKYTSDVFKFLKNSPEVEKQFTLDVVTKGICQKTMPDFLCSFHYGDDSFESYSKEDLMALYKDGKITQTSRQKLGFYAGKIQIAIGWQNCNGLCNPTIRGFIK